MGYLIGGVEIRRPTQMKVSRQSQYAQHKALDASVSRDYFGSDKLIFELEYVNIKDADYAVIVGRYDEYKAVGLRYFETTGEAVVYGTLVHLELRERQFSVKGSDYLSTFTLVLMEA